MSEVFSRVISVRSDDMSDAIIEILLEKEVAKNQSALIKKALFMLAKKELARSEMIALLANVQHRQINRMMSIDLSLNEYEDGENNDNRND